jgi:hypothetical protein
VTDVDRNLKVHAMRITFNWGTGIALVYTAFAVATAGFVTFAMGRSVDLVSGDYYAQSLQQNQKMDAERNALMLRPAPSLLRSHGHVAVLSLPADHVSSARGVLTLYRASNATADRTLPLALDGSGRQQISLEGMMSGRWILQVRWSAAGRDFYFEQPVDVR